MAWAKIFGLVAKDFDQQIAPALEYEILDCLRDLRFEVQLVEDQVKGTEAESATTPIAETVRTLTATNQLHTDWANVRANFLKPDLIAGWNWAAIHLSATDSEFDPGDVSKLRADLEELEKSARADGLPHDLRMLIDRQVRKIRSALRRYEIRGVEPLREVASAAMGEAIKEQEVIVNATTSDSPATREAVGRLGRVWQAVVDISGDADKIRKGVDAIASVAKALPFLRG